ncbi:MAG: ABC transporter ATP-binding protein/permease [Lachnospiraceae bacterium]|nr:ABC transporter ATP-binding protein/permease [Lachnospiraceae bacterium]
MLQIKKISKEYVTGELHQTALDKVSFNLRDNEFVAILGPSGSGKTTLLNVIGGLDRYDSGDLVINGISTKKYKDRDWDSYRNHTIGFVFQSYNLIPHQSILANVELALTISGISRSERRKRAKQALEQVGLGAQLHKRPNQMSGGQMQRVAIARALVNNPDILLADEPTGALDTETSVQVMELLKEVAKDRLVVMVTHNPELAEVYATRIVNLRDGKIVNDSDPYMVDETRLDAPKHENMGRASMSFSTALSLSFHNLCTKKGRTLLTSFAGSIGIIGIALILALSNGVKTYIGDLQKSTMTSYPITIESESMDLSAMMAAGKENADSKNTEVTHELDAVYSDGSSMEMASTMSMSISENNLTRFKEYLDDASSEIHAYIGENGIVYSYDTQFGVYTHDPDGVFVNTDGSTLSGDSYSSGMGMMGMIMGGSASGNDNFEEMLPGQNGTLISSAVTDSYDVLYGTWPNAYDEVVLVLDQNNEISANTLYELGILPTAEYKELMKKINDGEEITLETQNWSYEDVCAKELYMIPACDYYMDNGNGTFTDISEDTAELEKRMEDAIRLKIVGVIRPAEDGNYANISSVIGYTKALTDYIIDYTNESAVVKAQEASPEINVLTGVSFSPSDDAVDDAEAYISSGTYEENMTAFGVVSLDAPSAISIYADSFEDKDAISDCIEAYNKTVSEENQITYTDYVGLLMSSVTTIVNVISYVLIAFVAVSLIVSSIMIGIITYISVLERTKEIGILRAIGASKRNISQVFNAETFIIGLLSGLIGIGITLLLLIPGNAIIHVVTGSTDVNAILPVSSGVLLIILSVILTLIGGLIPSRKAARKDPVTALRTE